MARGKNTANHPARQVGRDFYAANGGDPFASRTAATSPGRGPSEATPGQVSNWKALGYGKPAMAVGTNAIVPGKGATDSYGQRARYRQGPLG